MIYPSDGIALPIQRLTEFAQAQNPLFTDLAQINLLRLNGGYSADVYRLELQFSKSHAELQSVFFVQKYTTASEVRLMQRLAQEIHCAELPTLIESYINEDTPENGASWFITPFYEGHTLEFDDDMPAAVLNALASIHAFYTSHAHQIDWLPQVDGTFVERLRDYALSRLEANQARFSPAQVTEYQQQLPNTADIQVLDTIFRRLPKTITHGDVHSGNIIQRAAGGYILFDWGNARLAPGMLDIANMVEIDSPEWGAYLAAWAAAGKPIESDVARLAYRWATAIINLQYLPFAFGQLEAETVDSMLGKFHEALELLRAAV
jgi:aminoglycoside phosphotransferase (APT) family kinase protein